MWAEDDATVGDLGNGSWKREASVRVVSDGELVYLVNV